VALMFAVHAHYVHHHRSLSGPAGLRV
jgi:hypothetical protein